jgi:hypothetical protein
MSLTHEIEKLSLYKAHMEVMSGLQLGSILDDAKADPKVAACVKAVVEAMTDTLESVQRVARLTPWISLTTSVLAGYAGASVIDTNKNPSALKTAVTGIVTGTAATAVSVGVMFQMLPSAELLAAKDECTAAGRTVEDVRSDIAELTDAQQAELATLLGVSKDELTVSLADAANLLAQAAGGLALAASLMFASSIAGAIHGYKRSGALGALGFFMLNSTGLGMALKQGYGKPISEVQTKG